MPIDEILKIHCPICNSFECPLIQAKCTECGTPFDPPFVKNEFFKKAGKSRSTGVLDNPDAKDVLIACISGLDWFLEKEGLYPKIIIKEDRVETPRVDPISEVVKPKRSLFPLSVLFFLILMIVIFFNFPHEEPTEHVQTPQRVTAKDVQTPREDSPKYVLKKGISGLNLRSGPTLKNDPITVILPGEQFEKIEDPISGWMKIKLDRDGYGFVWADYAVPHDNPPKYILKKGVEWQYLRSGPSVDSKLLTLIHPGDQFEKIEGPISGWMKIKLDGVSFDPSGSGYGFVRAENIVNSE